MCEPGSYVETGESSIDEASFVKSGTKVLFVTSDELSTAKGKKIVEDGAHLAGHDVIRKYYNPKKGFVEKQADLSDPDKMPTEMADAIRKGKFVGLWTAPDPLLSDKGKVEFTKAVEKIEGMSKKPKGGKYYATTEAFWKIFRTSAKNRAEAWA
jgi:hypothetical protein